MPTRCPCADVAKAPDQEIPKIVVHKSRAPSEHKVALLYLAGPIPSCQRIQQDMYKMSPGRCELAQSGRE